MGDALAVAIVLFQAMAVVVEGTGDCLLTQGQGEILDIARQPFGQYRQQVAGHRLFINLRGRDKGKALGWAAQMDGAPRAQQIHCAFVTIQSLNVDQWALGRHQQLVVHLFINDRLDQLLYPAKVQQHAHFVELTAHFDIYQPALTHHAAAFAQVAGVDHGQISYK